MSGNGNGNRRSKKLTLLLTSAGRRVALLQAFRRGAAQLGIELEVLACDLRPELSAACQVADGHFAVPCVEDPGYVDALLAIVRERGVDLIVPTIDPELLPLARAREAFAALGADVAVSAPELVEIARDKLATARFLEANQIQTPRTAPLAELREGSSGWHWPLIVKPRHGSASRSILTVVDPSELPEHEEEPMIAQELLRGTEWTVNLYFDRGGNLVTSVPHERLQIRAGEVEKGVTHRSSWLSTIAGKMAAALPGPRGVLCFQAMVAPGGATSVFEINARFGGGYPLADKAGATFARWLLEECADLPSSAADEWAEGVTMLRYDAAVFVVP